VAFDDGVRVARPLYPNMPNQPSWARADQLIARAAWGARRDWTGARLVHGHSAVEGLAAWRLARRAALPLVLTFHGSDIYRWPEENRDRLEDLRRALREARAVIAVSAALADRIRETAGVEAIHLPLGSDHGSLSAAAIPRREARRTLGLADDRVVVLFVGHLLRAKGVRELADAIVQLGDPFTGVFVGGGSELGYGGDSGHMLIRYTGERPHEDVVRYMCAADVLVLPSYSEGLPTVLVEAGALRLPVIASSVGGIPELLGTGRGTILSEVSSPVIADALRAFVATRSDAEAAALRLHAFVRERYDVDANAARLLDLYRSVAAPSGSGPRAPGRPER
jgi:teichuronic acid biosynthesis glycosyltransferase TuaC